MRKLTLRLAPFAAAIMILLVTVGYAPDVQAAQSAQMQVFTYMISTIGMSPAAACGAMANIQRESSYRPGVVNASSGAVGLCQWTASRTSALKRYCSSQGLSYLSMEGQLAFIRYELRNSYAKVYQKLMSLGNTRADAYTAGRYWCIYYEGSSAYASSAGRLAQSLYDSIAASFTPAVLQTQEAADGIGLTWTVYGSGKASLVRSENPTSGFETIAQVEISDGAYIDTTAKTGVTYYYGITPETGTWAYSTEKVEALRLCNFADAQAGFSLNKKSYAYTGSRIKPKVYAYYGNTLLVKGTDYTVSYGKNKSVGTGTVTVKGKGSYTGSVTLTFKIKKSAWNYAPSDKNIRLSRGTLTLKPPKSASATVTVANTKIASVKKSAKTTLKLKRAGTTVVTVVLAESKNHKETKVSFTLTLR